MSKQFSLALRGVSALAMAVMLPAAGVMWAPQALAAEVEITEAEFRWGLNKQSSGPSHGPGLNFLSAGDISGAITGPNTMIEPGDWKATSGEVAIEKRTANGSAAPATWAGVQTDQSNTALKSSKTRYSGLEMVFTGGEGTVDAEAGTAEIGWDGTVSVVYYSGFVYLTISDPVLKVDGSGAVVEATLGGHRSDRDDSSEWSKLTPRKVVLAEFDVDGDDLTDETGFSANPKYKNVRYPNADPGQPQTVSGSDWGSFPESFVNFAKDSGSGAFWYSTGTSDSAKVPLPLVVSWDSEEPQEVPDPDSGDSGNSGGIIGEVAEGAVEDIIRAAGADVVGTAEAWMDEAWKPLQPGAADAASGDASPAPAPVADDTTVVVRDDFTEAYVETYTAAAPMTAGTVGSTLASISAPAASGSAPAAANAPTVASQSAAPVSSNLPLTEVAYAQTSASSETGNPTPQWQWWVGAALLALAAGLFYQTVRRKD